MKYSDKIRGGRQFFSLTAADLLNGEIHRDDWLNMRAEVEVVCDKKSYSQFIGYCDKTLSKAPKIAKRQRRVFVAYAGIPQTPLLCGGFSPGECGSCSSV